MKNIYVLLTITLLSGCATIAGHTTYPVTISSSPNEAKFIVTNKAGHEVQSGITPSTVTLNSGAGYFSGEKYSVAYSKNGFNDAKAEIDSSVSGWYAGNLLIGGLIGLLIVDPLSGAMYKLPENVTTGLTQKP
jgi:hypothetical protein